jgi:hypothetical protein
MALKFRRGTTAQKSGSLAFGEPYVNTTLGTLQIGLDTGDVTLASSNGLISASSQVSYPELSNIPSGIISSSAQIDTLFNVDGLISASSQVDATSTTNFVSGVKTQLNSNAVVSGSSQIDLTATTNYESGILNQLNTLSVISGSSQVTLSSTNGYSAFSSSLDSRITTEKGRVDAILSAADADKDSFAEIVTLINSVDTTNDNTFASFYTASTSRLSNIESSTGSYETKGRGIVSGSSQISLGSVSGNSTSNVTEGTNLYYTDARVKTKLNVEAVISGSSQIDHNSTTNFVANKHIDHTAVSISAGSGLTGGGDISATRTLSIATSGVTNDMLAGSITNAKLVNSTISGISLGSNLSTLTIGTGLSGTSYNGSAGVTIANTGVTSAVAGTGVSVSGATGAVTISIGQSVATNATPTFGNLTINGTITATGDITAYYTSDKRHKNNIQLIPNALEKVSKLNGVTWEWNDDVNEVTKSTPKTGLIAQEVQSVLPEVVVERENGFLGLDYSKMMGLMVEAIKEQQTQIHNLTLEIEELKKQKGL